MADGSHLAHAGGAGVGAAGAEGTMTMECSCDYDYRPEFYVRTIHVARKDYRCTECSHTIRRGERYERAAGKWDGEVEVHKTCSPCLDLRDYVEAHVPCLCIVHGAQIEECMDTARNFAHEAPGLLFGACRRLIRIDRGARKAAG